MSSESEPIRFPMWKEVLAAESLPSAVREAYRRDILTFLHHCKVRRAPATVMLAKEYLAVNEKQGANKIREALRWFFLAARGHPVAVVQPKPAANVGLGKSTRVDRPVTAVPVSRAVEPPTAITDQGGAAWERDLIKACRTAGLLWRTEETYRGWACAVRWMADRGAEAEGGRRKAEV